MVKVLLNILPNLIGAISIAILIGVGHRIELGTAMEMIHLFNWMRSSFTNLISIRTDVLDAEIYLNRI